MEFDFPLLSQALFVPGPAGSCVYPALHVRCASAYGRATYKIRPLGPDPVYFHNVTIQLFLSLKGSELKVAQVKSASLRADALLGRCGI